MTEGFDVFENIEIEDIDAVKKVSNVIPATSGVKLKLSKVTSEWNKDKDMAMLAVSLKIEEGIPVFDPETGETEVKYKGSMATQFPVRFIYYVSLAKQAAKEKSAKKSTAAWWKNKQYLVEFKQLLVACGIDPKLEEFKTEGRLQVDALVSALKDREVLGDIKEVNDQAFDKETGEKKKLDSTHNEVKNLRRIQ